MSPAEAILLLRKKMKMTQPEFAKAVHIGARSLARYESGYEPGPKVFKKLAQVANNAGIEQLRDYFEGKRKAEILARVEELRSDGSGRHVPLGDLKYCSAYLRLTSKEIADIIHRRQGHEQLPWDQVVNILQNAAWIMVHVSDELELYIAEPQSAARIEEDKMLLLSQRNSRVTYRSRGERLGLVGIAGLIGDEEAAEQSTGDVKPRKKESAPKELSGKRPARRKSE